MTGGVRCFLLPDVRGVNGRDGTDRLDRRARIPGAMWWAGISEDRTSRTADNPSYSFADGPHLVVRLPNRWVWNIDSRASNCSLPTDYAHRCWVRHGDPPAITVDKVGLTCAAGAGSIAAGDYHGFLRAGYLVLA